MPKMFIIQGRRSQMEPEEWRDGAQCTSRKSVAQAEWRLTKTELEGARWRRKYNGIW